MKSHRLLAFATAIAVVGAYASAVAAATSCPTQINACGCTITQPGSYTVVTDLSPAVLLSDCITIDAPDVRLDLAGKTISVPPPGPGPQPLPPQALVAGIHLTKKASNAIVAGDGATISNFAWGVIVESAGAQLGGFTASSNQEAGVMLVRAVKARVFNFDASQNGDGIDVLGALDCVIEGFTADGNGNDGVLIGDSCKPRLFVGPGIFGFGCKRLRKSSGTGILGGQASGNAYGIVVDTAHNQMISNTAKSNSNTDLLDGNGDCGHNQWFGNSFASSNPACIQ